MTQFKVFLSTFLLFFTLSAFAQIEKGNYNIGGDAELNSAFAKGEYFNTTNLNINISPSISKFLTDKWLVGIRPILSTNFQKGDFSEFFNPDSKYPLEGNFKKFGLGLSTRYYLSTNKKLKWFAYVNASYDKQSSFYNAGNIYGDDSENIFLNYEAGFGANVFFNSEIALESTISYAHRETNKFADPFTLARLVNSQNFLLNFSINNFINITQKNKNETPQYVKKGRRVLGGKAWFGNIEVKDQRTDTKYGIAPQFGQFITDKVMISGNLLWQGDIKEIESQIVKATITARYYHPIKKRLFIYPEINTTYSSGRNLYSSLNYPYSGDGDYSRTEGYKINIGFGLGGSYFLSNNVALDATLLQAHLYLLDDPIKSEYFTSQLGVGRIGFLYFIR